MLSERRAAAAAMKVLVMKSPVRVTFVSCVVRQLGCSFRGARRRWQLFMPCKQLPTPPPPLLLLLRTSCSSLSIQFAYGSAVYNTRTASCLSSPPSQLN